MAGYHCKYCPWEPSDPGATNNVKFTQLGSHCRAEHMDRMIAKADATRSGKKKGEPNGSQADTSNKVAARVSGETLTLPADIFLGYHLLRANYPQYTATKAEYLQQVVSVNLLEHAEEYQLDLAPLRFITQHLPGNLDPGEDPIEDPAPAGFSYGGDQP